MLPDGYGRRGIGKKRISDLRKSFVKRFYNRLSDDRGLKPAAIGNVQTVLHQVPDMAADDSYIRSNPSDRVLKELMQAHAHEMVKHRGLTLPEQELFPGYLKDH